MAKKKKEMNHKLLIGVLLAIFLVVVLYNTITQDEAIVQMSGEDETCYSNGGFCHDDSSNYCESISGGMYETDSDKTCSDLEERCCMFTGTGLDSCLAKDGFCLNPSLDFCGGYDLLEDYSEWFNSEIFQADGPCSYDFCCEYSEEAEENEKIAVFKFDDNVLDTSGKSIVTENNAVSFVDGRFRQAGSFDGTSSYVKLKIDSLNEIGSSDFTISAWLKPSQTVSDKALILGTGDGITDNTFSLTYNSQSSISFDWTSSSQGVDGVIPINDEKWHHVALIKRGTSGLYLYIDGGTPEHQIGSLSVINTFQNAPKIGGGFDLQNFPGLIDELTVYNYALGEEQIKALAWGCLDDGDCEEDRVCNNGICSSRWIKLNFWEQQMDLKDVFAIGNEIRTVGSQDIFYSPDAGVQWGQQHSTVETFNSICFFDSSNGWVVGTEGKIFNTSNGADWGQIDIEENSDDLNSVFCKGSNIIWAIGEDGRIINTTNGKNWSENVLDDGSKDLKDIHFVGDFGRVVGDKGIMYQTTDGGETWEFKTIYDGASLNFNSVYFTDSNNDFTDSNNGWVVMDHSIGFKYIGSGTWAPMTFPQFLQTNQPNFNSVYFTDSLNGWIVGNEGTILKSTDGGLSWELIDLRINENLNSIFFDEEGNGYIVGNGGTIWKYLPEGTGLITCWTCSSGSCISYEFSSCSGAYSSQSSCQESCTEDACEYTFSETQACNITDNKVLTYTSLFTECDDYGEIQDCDFNSLGVIGTESEVETKRIDFELEINDGAFDSTEKYDKDDTKVEIFNDDEKLIEFEFDFSSESLNLREIELEKQTTSKDFGYLIIQGLEDIDKIAYIDKIDNSSNAVCIKDREIDDIDDIDEDCMGSNEKKVFCPGSSSGYECELSSGRYEVSGLENSAVKEFTYTNNHGCTASWSCTYSDSANNCGTKTCVESNCGMVTTTETIPCNQDPPTNQDDCSSDNDCEQDEECDNGECVPEDPDTEDPENKWILYLIIGVLAVLVLIVIGLIIYSSSRSKIPGSQRRYHPRGPPRSPPNQAPPM